MGATSRLGGPTIFGEPRPQPVDNAVDSAPEPEVAEEPVTEVVAGPEVAAEGRLAAPDIDSLSNRPAAGERLPWFADPPQ